MGRVLPSGFDEIFELKHLGKYTYSMQKLRLCHNWDEYYAQFSLTFDTINWVELVELDIAIDYKKNMNNSRF